MQGSYGAPDAWAVQRGPDFSQRHEYRTGLKKKLLHEIRGEAVDRQADYEAIQIVLTDEVRERLETRLILIEDIQRVIAYAERTGRKFANRATGHWLASFKPHAVTFWVEYAPQDDTFVIYNAFSYRMRVGEEPTP